LSGHADGSIVRYFLEDEGTGETQVTGHSAVNNTVNTILLQMYLGLPKNTWKDVVK